MFTNSENEKITYRSKEDVDKLGMFGIRTGITDMKDIATDLLVQLSGHGGGHGDGHHQMSEEEIRYHEVEVFYVTRYYHFISFVMILLMIHLKKTNHPMWG